MVIVEGNGLGDPKSNLGLDCLHFIYRYYIWVTWSGKPGFSPCSSHTKNSKMVLDVALLNSQHYKVHIKDKVELSREWSSALPYTY